MKEEKSSISEWLEDNPEQSQSHQGINFDSKEIGFFTSRKQQKSTDSRTTRSNRQERYKESEFFQIQYSNFFC